MSNDHGMSLVISEQLETVSKSTWRAEKLRRDIDCPRLALC